MNTTAASLSVEVESWFQATALIESLASRGATVSSTAGTLSVKPKGIVTDDDRRDLKALKDTISRILEGEQIEWTLEHCRAVLEPIQQRRWLLAPREFVLRHWPEMAEGSPWRKRFDLFPHGLRSISEPLTVLLEGICKDPSPEEINKFLRIAVGKRWGPIVEGYRNEFMT